MKYLSISLITLIALLLASVPGYGQEPNLIVNHVATVESADQVKLQVYFTPVEQTGRPAIELNLDETGSVQLLGEGMGIAEAKVHKPNEPIYIMLLLDASGSMLPLMAQVQAAAISSLEHAPSNAHFAVIQFNDVPPTAELRLPRDFTADRNLVAKDIRDVQAASGAPTCLYNATDKAIEMLRKTMKPEQRGAVILFTDGRDQRQDPTQPCSNRTLDDVTYSAVGVAGIDIPVHTIGLCTDDSCSNLDQAALANLAKGTIGFAAIGNQTNLGSMFEQIMAGLNSQWLATTTVYPRKGRNDAVLKVRTSDQNPLEFTTSFSFESTVDTLRPAPPAVATIDNFHTVDATTYEFAVSVNSSDPNSIAQVVVQTYNEQNIQVNEQVLTREDLTRPLRLDAKGFADGEHTVQVKAVDQQGNFIPKADGNADSEFVLATWPFTYKAPPSIQAPVYTINTVDAVRESNGSEDLVIKLNLPGDQGADLIYEGYIKFKEGGGEAGRVETALLKGTQIVVPLPDLIRNQTTPTEYELHLTLRRGNEGVNAEQVFTFSVQPASQPGRLDQFRQWVQKNWMWLLFILSFVLTIFIWQMVKKRRQERENAKIVRPERNPPTQVATTGEATTTRRPLPPTTSGTTKQITPHLLLQTCEGGSQTQPLEQELSHFPCVLGRNEKLIHGRVTPLGKRYYLNLLGDAKISRLHVEIKLQGGQFYVTDLKSRNKTKLNGQYLEPETPMQINGLSELQIGPDTRLEIHTFL